MSARPPITSLDRLNDVSVTSPTDGQGLIFNAGLVKWTNVAIPGGSLATLSDVLIGTPTDGQLLIYSAGSWINSGPLGFTDITGNIAVTQMANGSGATPTTFWCGNGTWIPIPGAGAIVATSNILTGDGSGSAISTSPALVMGTTGLQSTGTNDGDFMLNWWNTAIGPGATNVATGLHMQVADGYAQIKLIGSSNSGTGIVTPDDLWIRQHMVPSGPKKANIVLSTAGDQFLYSNDDGVTLRVLIGFGVSVGSSTDPGAGVINALTGYRVAGAATSGKILKANGTNFVASTETYAAPGASGNVMKSDGTNWTSAASTSGGTVTSITATSPILASTNPIIATGTLSLATNVDLALTAAQTITQATAATATVVNGLTLTENSTGVAANGLGTGILLRAETSTTNSQDQASIQSAWSDVTHASRTAYLDFLVANNPGTVASRMRLFGPGSLSVGGTTDPGAGIINANTGYKVAGATPTTGKILRSDGSKFGPSTETYAIPGTSGNVMTSDGTNWTSVTPVSDLYVNASAAGAAGFAANQTIPGSIITLATGAWKAGGAYHCTFDMGKTAAGVAAIAINIHMGTLGTTGDAIVSTATFAAGTAAADVGYFDVWVTFKAVGSGTAAVIFNSCRVIKSLTATGLVNSATIVATAGGLSAGFNSTTQTKLSIGFNGGTLFSGTNNFVQTEYKQ